MSVPHVRVPISLLLDERVSPRARDLWCYLDDMCREQRTVTIDAGTLAGLVGVQPRQLRTVAQELCDAGWLHVTTVAGRGHANLYSPLGRAREGLVGSVDDAVDPGREKRQSIAGFTSAKAAVIRRFSSRGTSHYTRGEEAQGQTEFDLSTTGGAGGAARRPAWCGGCDQTSRCIPVADGGFSRVGVDGAWARCPACHPAMVPAF